MGQGKDAKSQLKQFEEANKIVTEMYRNLLRNHKKYEKMVNKMDKKQQKEMKSRLKAQDKRYKLMLKQLKTEYNKSKKYMTDSEKQAHKLLYTQRKKDFKKLRDMAEDTFEDIGDALEDQIDESIDKATSRWDEFADHVSNIAVDLSIADNITDALSEETESLNEIKNSIMAQTDMNREEVDKYMNEMAKTVDKQFKGMYNITDAMEVTNDLVEQGINSQEQLNKLVPQILKTQTIYKDIAADQLEMMIRGSQQLDVPIDYWMNQIVGLDQKFAVSGETLINAFEENYESVYKAANGDKDEFNRRMSKLMATTATIEDSWGDTGGLMEFLNTMKDLDPTEYADYAQQLSLMGLSPQQLQSMMKSGDIDQAMMAVVKGVQSAYAKGLTPEMEQWVTNQFKGLELDKLKTLDVSTLDTQLNNALQTVDLAQSEDYIQTQMEDAIISPFTRAINKFKNSSAGLFLSNLSSDTGIDMGDLIVGNALIGNPVGKGLGKLGSWIGGGIKSLLGFGGGSAVATEAVAGAGGTATGGGVLSSIGSTVGGAVSSALAPVASALGVGTGVAGVSVLGAIGGAGGLFSAMRDLVIAWKENDAEKKSEKKWQAGSKAGMVGAGAATGAAIGSVVPVVGTAAGAIIGAGLGGLGAIFGGDKAGSWLKDKWDGLSKGAQGTIKGVGATIFDSFLPGNKGLRKGAGTLWNWLWGKNQQNLADDAISSQGEMKDSSKELGETSTSMYDRIISKLKLLKKTALDTSSSYTSSMNKMNTSTSTLNTTVDTTTSGSNSSTSTTKKSTFKWYNPFTWFNGSHKDGLDEVPFDGYIAQLHKGETVLTKEEADLWRQAMKSKGKNQINLNPREEYTGGARTQLKLAKGAVIGKDGTIAELHAGEAVLTKDQSRSWFADSTSWFSKLSAKMKAQAQEAMDKFWTLQRTAPTTTDTTNGGDTSYTDISGASSYEQGVWKFLTGIGYSKQATAGILGNMYQESGVNPTMIQGNGRGPAAGICQWENYNTKSARWKSMSDYAQSKGKQWTDLQSQLEWLDKEMQGKDPTTLSKLKSKVGGYDAFKKLTDVAKATLVFEESFERAGKPNMTRRYKAANDYYSKFNAYEQGTPWVPNTQVALLHKGEMVVPASENPINKLTRSSQSGVSDTVQTDNSDLVDVIKWAVQRIERKMDENSSSTVNNTTYNMNQPTTKSPSNARDVFRF